MTFKIFTNAVEGHVDESIAINPFHIINVYERVTTVATAEGNKEKKEIFSTQHKERQAGLLKSRHTTFLPQPLFY